MTIDTNQNNSISGPSAGGVRVGTDFAPHSNNNVDKSSTATTIENSATSAIVVTEPAKTTPGTTARSDPSEQDGKDVPEQVQHKDVARLNDYVQNIRRRLEFRLDETTNRTVVTVIDQDTQEVIRQIPSEAALKLVQRLSDLQGHPGSLLDDRA